MIFWWSILVRWIHNGYWLGVGRSQPDCWLSTQYYFGCFIGLSRYPMDTNWVFASVSQTDYTILSWQCCWIRQIFNGYYLNLFEGQPDNIQYYLVCAVGLGRYLTDIISRSWLDFCHIYKLYLKIVATGVMLWCYG